MRPRAVRVLAPAKINLTLHVVGRRPDGYHLLDSLVVFAETGDRLELRRAARTSLTLCGRFASEVSAGPDNLALRAAELANARVAISLEKRLPVGGGIGGGSSDAAAVLRGVAALFGETRLDPLSLGADIPVCLAAEPSRMRGIGERLAPVPPLPELPMVLVHPGLPVATADVFAGLAAADGAPMPALLPRWSSTQELAGWLAQQRNDLEPAAIACAAEIGEARAALAATQGCLIARMSGSGSTVFGIFGAAADAERAAAQLAARHARWWVRPTRALSAPPEVQEIRLTT